jgi:hypothetical protein
MDTFSHKFFPTIESRSATGDFARSSTTGATLPFTSFTAIRMPTSAQVPDGVRVSSRENRVS